MNRANKYEVKKLGFNVNDIYVKCWKTINDCANDTFSVLTTSDRRAISEQTLYMVDSIITLSKKFSQKQRRKKL